MWIDLELFDIQSDSVERDVEVDECQPWIGLFGVEPLPPRFAEPWPVQLFDGIPGLG